MNGLGIITILAVLTAFLSVLFLFFNWIKYVSDNQQFKDHQIQTPPSFPIKSVSFFIVPIFIAIIISQFGTVIHRNRVATFFQQLPEERQVYINKTFALDAEQVISTLSGVTPYWAHHSHPSERIYVEIVSPKNRLALELRRDSGNPREYWMFYADESGLDTEIGRITTSLFDEF